MHSRILWRHINPVQLILFALCARRQHHKPGALECGCTLCGLWVAPLKSPRLPSSSPLRGFPGVDGWAPPKSPFQAPGPHFAYRIAAGQEKVFKGDWVCRRPILPSLQHSFFLGCRIFPRSVVVKKSPAPSLRRIGAAVVVPAGAELRYCLVPHTAALAVRRPGAAAGGWAAVPLVCGGTVALTLAGDQDPAVADAQAMSSSFVRVLLLPVGPPPFWGVPESAGAVVPDRQPGELHEEPDWV